MSFNVKVSIIIPVYNGSNYLAEAIDSALAQTYKNIEVIVVNDGSIDGGRTEAIALSYKDRIRYFFKDNGGVASALNLGIQKAKGEFISWLSHDDLFLPSKIEKQVQYLGNTANRKVILFSDFEALDLRNKSIYIYKIEQGDRDKLYNALLLLFRSAIHGCTMFIPKEAFNEVALFNEELRTTQDYELWFKMLKRGYEFVHIPEILLRARWHEEQGTLSMSTIHCREVEGLYDWAIELFSDEIKTLSYYQIEKIIVALRNKSLKRAQHRILKSWRGNNPLRFFFQILIESK